MVNVTTFSEVGDHQGNEDAFAVLRHPLDTDVVFCCVADGQGGQPGGGPAARLACRIATEAVSQLPPDRLKDRSLWVELLKEVDTAVALDQDAGYSTFVGV